MLEFRFNIGLFIDSLSGTGSYQASVWHGVNKAAEERNANLFCAAGGSVNFSPNNKYEKSRNLIYDLINEKSIDGLIITGGTIGNYISKEELLQFCGRYKGLPMVSIGGPVEGIPSVLIDNQSGLKSLISHLIEKHRYKKIAFIRGPEGNEDAAERYRVYLEMLQKYDIPFDPALVAAGNYLESSGAEAVRMWLDEKEADIQAVIGSNDNMALGALKELQRRGIQVPFETAVAGFDDIEDASAITPSLSTVRQPVFEQSKRAALILMDMLEGKTAKPQNEYLTTEIIIRQSCGCQPISIQQSRPIKFERSKEDYKSVLSSVKMKTLAALTSVIKSGSDYSHSDLVQRLLDAFYIDIIDNQEGNFFSSLDSILAEVISEGEDITIWQSVISELRNRILPLLNHETLFSKAEGIFQKALLFIGEMALRAISSKKMSSEKQSYQLSMLGQALSTTFDLNELEEAVLRELPNLNIPSFYISLFGNKAAVADNCRIFLAYKGGQKLALRDEEVHYPGSILIPKNILPAERRFTMIVLPLYFKTEQLGFILMEAGPLEGIIYETTFIQISSSLEGGLLLNKSRRAESDLEKRNQNIESVVLPMIESIKQVALISAERMKLIRALAEKTRDSYKKISETNIIIEKAAANIHKILQIINIINGISSTVNLMALNASIEATHAGEYGSGFAIIAKEIKKLSASTKKNSEEISKTLKEVVQNVQDSAKYGQEGLASFEEQRKGVESILQSLEIISKNMDSLSDGSRKILTVMNR